MAKVMLREVNGVVSFYFAKKEDKNVFERFCPQYLLLFYIVILKCNLKIVNILLCVLTFS